MHAHTHTHTHTYIYNVIHIPQAGPLQKRECSTTFAAWGQRVASLSKECSWSASQRRIPESTRSPSGATTTAGRLSTAGSESVTTLFPNLIHFVFVFVFVFFRGKLEDRTLMVVQTNKQTSGTPRPPFLRSTHQCSIHSGRTLHHGKYADVRHSNNTQ